MNKKDYILIIILIIISSSLFLIFKGSNGSKANVYYKSDIILTIDLKKDKSYTVKGDNGDVIIEVKNKKIRVIQENSPYKICSKQGFIEKTNESIVCLPNKIVIEVLGETDIDTQVK